MDPYDLGQGMMNFGAGQAMGAFNAFPQMMQGAMNQIGGAAGGGGGGSGGGGQASPANPMSDPMSWLNPNFRRGVGMMESNQNAQDSYNAYQIPNLQNRALGGQLGAITGSGIIPQMYGNFGGASGTNAANPYSGGFNTNFGMSVNPYGASAPNPYASGVGSGASSLGLF